MVKTFIALLLTMHSSVLFSCGEKRRFMPHACGDLGKHWLFIVGDFVAVQGAIVDWGDSR